MKRLLSVSLVALAGCASITTGTSQNILVDTPKVTGARCQLTDKKGGTWHAPDTPGTVTVRKGDGPMTIICKKDGYKPNTIQVDEDLAGATLGNIILGGGIGILVDATTGAAQQYPDKVVIWMEPESFPSEAARASWIQDKKAYEQSILDAEAKKQEQEKMDLDKTR
ncbi:MAG: hypothetical protein HQL86_01990 [Magnetococcales bacterium]|nr:hypothetical protein [Magnetococcales bacterium]